MDNVKLIATEGELEALAAELLKGDAVAVDTEFFWERTFYPVLGLVQLATGDNRCWLVDAVKIPNLAALGPVMASPSIVKVLHDAPQDLAILARATGTQPSRIFDTRLAAGFANMDPTCSLQSLLREVLGVELCKAETRSDWLRRPLRTSQLQYAAADVLHLLPLRDALLERCAADEPRAWLREEMARVEGAVSCLERDPRSQYLRVKGAARLSARQMAIMREVAAWRELEARQRDWPRGHVLPDDLLISLACLAPADRAALARVSNFPRNMPESLLADLLAAVARGLSVPDAACPQPFRSDGPGRNPQKARVDALLAHIRSACAVHRIHASLVASRAEAESFVNRVDGDDAGSHSLAQGWRKRFIEGMPE
jgi:ribonuclease D